MTFGASEAEQQGVPRQRRNRLTNANAEAMADQRWTGTRIQEIELFDQGAVRRRSCSCRSDGFVDAGDGARMSAKWPSLCLLLRDKSQSFD
jgi:hypothetical protein